ncbi:hypothetical protein AB0N17_20180 [Streptomyces sp. NPDC051133]|uniref:hypothetical protein n=1 Tax=Streptomyces sp. NPDC051133 TaxID=3155521 RepID=UPI00341ADE4E
MDNTTAAPPAADSSTGYLLAALDEVRAWRHRHPHFDSARFAELDAILDRAAVGRIERRLDLPEATSLPEAVNAHHAVMNLRRRILADAHRAWDLVEARAMRQIARFMPATDAE